MESYHVYSLKIAMLKRQRLSKITNFFRLIEICIFLVLISRFSTHLPVAVKNSGKYFWGILVILVSPHFVFVLGNAIVITLFVKSGWFSGQDSAEKGSENDLYDKFVEKCHSNIKYHTENSSCKSSSVSKSAQRVRMVKSYKRSQSEKLNQGTTQPERSQIVLRRSETDKCISTVTSVVESVENYCPEDNMSSEEFRCMVEAFIARQQRLRMEEEFSV